LTVPSILADIEKSGACSLSSLDLEFLQVNRSRLINQTNIFFCHIVDAVGAASRQDLNPTQNRYDQLRVQRRVEEVLRWGEVSSDVVRGFIAAGGAATAEDTPDDAFELVPDEWVSQPANRYYQSEVNDADLVPLVDEICTTHELVRNTVAVQVLPVVAWADEEENREFEDAE
jgi:hypothetical protein